MKDFYKRVKYGIKRSSKSSLIVYLVLRFMTIFCMIRELMLGNIENALLCILSLILFLLPSFVEKKFKIDLPNVLEIIIFLFIFSAEILGEINNFYGLYAHFDDILHTINGFLCASIGFSLVYILNKNISTFNLSPIFVSLVAFCFSMTIGVLWEFFEYGMDKHFNFDMQKDTYIYKLNTVSLSDNENKIIKIYDIDKTIIDNGLDEKIELKGYLDIGLIDTMNDLFVNFIGAFVYSVFGYLYIINKDKYKLAGRFITKKI
ncbi:MAG: hypothetical protein IJD92_04630 [Bacilli bacterium]|nr:hypothetical protein [Bacilli bacterium]